MKPETRIGAFVYLHVYELLNGIGAGDASDRLQKMEDLERTYFDKGFGDERIRQNMRRWMMELSIISGLPKEISLKYAPAALLERDFYLSALHAPDNYSDREITDALFYCP